MKIHLLSQVSAFLARVDEGSRKFETKSYIVGAAAPFPVPYTRQGVGGTSGLMVSYPCRQWTPALVTVVTGTRFYGTLAAGPGYRMGNSCTRYCVYKSRFSTTWNKRTNKPLETGTEISSFSCSTFSSKLNTRMKKRRKGKTNMMSNEERIMKLCTPESINRYVKLITCDPQLSFALNALKRFISFYFFLLMNLILENTQAFRFGKQQPLFLNTISQKSRGFTEGKSAGNRQIRKRWGSYSLS